MRPGNSSLVFGISATAAATWSMSPRNASWSILLRSAGCSAGAFPLDRGAAEQLEHSREFGEERLGSRTVDLGETAGTDHGGVEIPRVRLPGGGVDPVDYVLLAVAEQLDQVNALAVRRLEPEPDPAERLGGAVGEQALRRPADPSRRRSQHALGRALDQVSEACVEDIDVEAGAVGRRAGRRSRPCAPKPQGPARWSGAAASRSRSRCPGRSSRPGTLPRSSSLIFDAAESGASGGITGMMPVKPASQYSAKLATAVGLLTSCTGGRASPRPRPGSLPPSPAAGT